MFHTSKFCGRVHFPGSPIIQVLLAGTNLQRPAGGQVTGPRIMSDPFCLSKHVLSYIVHCCTCLSVDMINAENQRQIKRSSRWATNQILSVCPFFILQNLSCPILLSISSLKTSPAALFILFFYFPARLCPSLFHFYPAVLQGLFRTNELCLELFLNFV